MAIHDLPKKWRERAHGDAGLLACADELEAQLKKAAGPWEAQTLANAQREHILRALQNTDWVVGGPNGAAARLGLKRTTLLHKMGLLGISHPQQ